jgi:putative transposase
MAPIVAGNPQFFTATILNWQPLLKDDIFKMILTDSLSFLTHTQRVIIYSFVVMPNHIHLIWQIRSGHDRPSVQRDFLKYTAYKMLEVLKKRPADVSLNFKVNASDRQFQVWERNSLSIDLFTKDIFYQKLDYIHRNPVQPKWNLCEKETDYLFSSAAYYKKGIKTWDFLSLYNPI